MVDDVSVVDETKMSTLRPRPSCKVV